MIVLFWNVSCREQARKQIYLMDGMEDKTRYLCCFLNV